MVAQPRTDGTSALRHLVLPDLPTRDLAVLDFFAIEALLYRREPNVGTVLASSICHYCGDKATTEDHIVPRADLPKPLSLLPYWFRMNNVVPACFKCNVKIKGCYRSDCTCDQCTWAWDTAIACFLPDGYTPRGHVNVVRSPG